MRTRTDENVKLLRANVTKETLEEYIKNLETAARDVPPQNIYNFDETKVTNNPEKNVAIYQFLIFLLGNF